MQLPLRYGISPFVGEAYGQAGLLIFTLIFFGVTLWLSLNPAKIVNNVGKILSPGIVILLFALLAMVVIKPMGAIGSSTRSLRKRCIRERIYEGCN